MDKQVTRITSKGQMTIPANLRKALRIKSGDYLAVSREGSRIIVEALNVKQTGEGIIRKTAGLWKNRDFDLRSLRHADDHRFEESDR